VYRVLDPAREPVDQGGGALDSGDRRLLAPAGEVADRELARIDPARRAHAVGHRLDDQLLGRPVELGIAVVAVSSHERMGELVHERLDAPVRRVRDLDDDRLS
jgi:hypothetical protein